MKRVYFIKPVGEQGPIKIGCSKMPEKRLRGIEIWSPQLLEIIVTVEGDHREENILQQMFKDERLHGEWFAYSDQLGSLISFVKRTGKLPPLDYSLSPYATRRKSAVGKRGNPKTVASKCGITARINAAEKRVLTWWGIGTLRPIEVQEIVESYQGFGAKLPTKKQLKVIDDYVAKLNEMPAADKTLASFHEWQQAVKAAA